MNKEIEPENDMGDNRWAVVQNWQDDRLMDVQVVPLDDLLEHSDEGTECWCDPRIEVEGAGLLVVHNSFDGREIREDGERVST